MKQNIGGPAGVIIVVVVVIAAIAFGYKFMAGPSKISPEETRKAMNAAQGGGDQGHAAKSGGPPSMAPGGTSR